MCYVQVTGSWFTVSSLNGNAPPSLSWHNTHSAGDAESILTSYITFARYVTVARYISVARYVTFARCVTVARYVMFERYTYMSQKSSTFMLYLSKHTCF